MATIAGNFVNASPIGDMTAMMLALDAKLEIANKDKNRTIALKNFFLDYKKIDLAQGESIARIIFKLPKTDSSTNSCFDFEKVSKRKHLDIATVNTSIHIEVIENCIKSIDLAVGGVAAIPKYLTKTCEFLTDQTINAKTLSQAIKVMNSEIAPISDVRGTDVYKRLLAEQLIKAHFY